MNKMYPFTIPASLVSIVLLLIVVLLVIPSVPSMGPASQAQENSSWYVAPTGNDDNDCLSPTTPCRTIQAAVDKASTGDTINVAAGVYTETISLNFYKNVTVRGAGAASTIIDGGGSGPVIHVFHAGSSTISDVTIRNGVAEDGGGIHHTRGTLTLDGCIITSNSAENAGGAIHTGRSARETTATLKNCVIVGNNADMGGGIWSSYGTLILSNTVVSSNTARVVGGIVGHTVILDNSAISGNASVRGCGGISAGPIAINNSTISNNDAGIEGGGICAGEGVIANSTISRNSAGHNGGGISNGGTAYSGLRIVNTRISDNTANSDGGGIHIYNHGTLTVTDSIISGNSAHSGGGIDNAIGVATVINTSISHNTATTGTGGGISTSERMAIADSVISDNFAAVSGGGISSQGAVMTITNSTISGNSAGERGGGIRSFPFGGREGDVTIVGSTVSDNIATYSGGGIYTVDVTRILFSTISDNVVTDDEYGHGGGVLGSSWTTIVGSTVSGNAAKNGGGIVGGVTANYNCIIDNSDVSFYSSSSPVAEATANWWGAADGPAIWDNWGRVGGGSGDSILEDTVNFAPWLLEPPFDCSNPPYEPPPESTEKPDLSVDHIQVAQVLFTDEVPLIAGKPTLVRVYVDGATSVPLVGVRLYVQHAGGQQIHDVVLAGVTHSPDFLDLDSTANFYFVPPADSLSGNVIFRAEVDPFDIVAERNESNNSSLDVEKTFQSGKQLRIAWTLIPYLHDGGAVTASIGEASQGHSFLRKIYPVGINDVDYFFQPGFPTILEAAFSCSISPLSCPAKTEYIRELNRFWDRLTHFGGWIDGSPPDRLYGWVPVVAGEALCGYADARWGFYIPTVFPQGKGRVAAGLDFPHMCNSTGSETLAHEVGHLLNDTGLRHAPCGGAANPDPNYPYPNGSIGEWGVDLWESTPQLLSPADTYDFMSYCKPWVSPYNYDKLHTGFAPSSMGTVTAPNAFNTVTRKLLVSGIIYTPSLKVDLDPFYAISSTEPAEASSGGRFCLEQRDKGGAPLDTHCFELGFIGLESGNPITEDAFALVVSHPVSATQIVLKHSGSPIHSLMVSENAPTVTLTYPNGGESWSGTETYTVTWAANDMDGGPLFYALDYSTDAGNSWIPVGTDITSTHQVLDASNLPGSSTALLRVSASDGVNTADDYSDSVLTVGRKPPQASILSPKNDAMVSPGTPIFLQGYAFDLEDGTLSESSMSWKSSLDGDLGTGHQLLVTLSPGQHAITLAATDSDDNTATVAVTATIVSIAKSAVPDGRVAYGDELTYTVVVASMPGTRVRIYDPLDDATFLRFVKQPSGVTHDNQLNGTLYPSGVVTGTLEITPGNRVAVSFVAKVGVPGTVGWTADVTNRACVFPLGGTLGTCVWSNEVTNPAFRPYEIYLPLVMRNH